MRLALAILLALAAPAAAQSPGDPNDNATNGTGAVSSNDQSGGVATGTAKGTIGVGIVIGDPTGVSARLYLADDQAIQAAAGWALLGGGLDLSVDYCFHPIVFQSREDFVLAGYVGPGVRVMQYRHAMDERTVAIGARGVLGLLFDFTIPLDAFVEAGIVLEIESGGRGVGVAPFVDAGVRYYF